MLHTNMEIVIENNLTIEELIVLSALDLISEQKHTDTFDYKYMDLINSLPIVFRSTERGNVKKLRQMLNKDGVKNFVTRTTKQLGRGNGACVTFYLDKEKLKKLNVKGIIS